MKDLAGSGFSERANRREVAGPKGEGRDGSRIFPAYPEYKDSGVEWLGEVPAHWSVPKLKHLARIRNGRDYKAVEVDDGGYPVIGSGGEFARASDYLYKGESVLLGRKGTIDKPLYVDGAFWTVDTMFYTEIGEDVHGRFLYYYSKCFRYDQYSTNTALPSMAQEDLSNIHLAVPGCAEQATIAAFLDHETARIDALVEEQQRLIALLKEKRQAVISHAVTKGLDPDVPMKDSGVGWLGEVPANWRIGSLKHTLEVVADVDHYMPTSVDSGIPYVMTGDLRRLASEIDLDSCKQISREDFLKLSRKIRTSRGDVIMARYATIGTVSYVDIDSDFIVSYSCVTIRPRASLATGMYLFFYFQSDPFVQGISRMINANTQGNVGVGDLKEVKIALPDIHEQKAIVHDLEAKLTELDRIATNSQVTIGLLKERRSALISAAVTGKIDVRGWTPPAYSTPAQQDTRMEAV